LLGIEGCLHRAPGSDDPRVSFHRDRGLARRLFPGGDKRRPPIEFRLMHNDFPGEVGLRLGEAVRPGRDPADHRLPGLGSFSPRLRRGRPRVVAGLLAPQLLGDLLSRPADPSRAVGLATPARRDPVAVGTLAAGAGLGVLPGVSLLRFADHRRDLVGEPHPASVGVDRGVRGDLGPVDRDCREVAQTCLGRDHQNLLKQAGERVAALGPEPGDRAMVGHVLGAQHPVGDIGDAQPLDLAGGPDTTAVGVDQQA